MNVHSLPGSHLFCINKEVSNGRRHESEAIQQLEQQKQHNNQKTQEARQQKAMKETFASFSHPLFTCGIFFHYHYSSATLTRTRQQLEPEMKRAATKTTRPDAKADVRKTSAENIFCFSCAASLGLSSSPLSTSHHHIINHHHQRTKTERENEPSR